MLQSLYTKGGREREDEREGDTQTKQTDNRSHRVSREKGGQEKGRGRKNGIMKYGFTADFIRVKATHKMFYLLFVHLTMIESHKSSTRLTCKMDQKRIWKRNSIT